jgi:peptidoglycan/LPS O-acetylase OafA/YrhL
MTSNDGTTPDTGGLDPVAQANAAIGQMSQGEKLVGLGAILIVLGDLIGGLFADEYFVNTVLWTLAILALAALFVRRMRGRDMPVAYGWVLTVLGFAAALVGIRIFLGDVTNDLFDRGGGTIVFALVMYAGVGLMGFGASQMSKT